MREEVKKDKKIENRKAPKGAKSKKKLTGRTWGIIFVIMFLVLYGIIYVVPKVSDIFLQTYSAEYGTLESSFQVQCIFVRDERVYRADAEGSVQRHIEGGTLVRNGSHIVTVAGTNYYNGERGTVSYRYDGYETRVTSADMAQLTKSFFEGYSASEGSVKAMNTGTVQTDQPVFKIIDNKEWFLVCWIPTEEAAKLEPGQAVKIKIDEADKESLEMKVVSLTNQGGEYQTILSCNRTYKDFDKYRVKECTIITFGANGIILETNSIVEKDGVKGVYVVDKLGDANFVPVSILFSYGEKTVVVKNYFYDSQGYSVATVKNYDEVLKEPQNPPA